MDVALVGAIQTFLSPHTHCYLYYILEPNIAFLTRVSPAYVDTFKKIGRLRLLGVIMRYSLTTHRRQPSQLSPEGSISSNSTRGASQQSGFCSRSFYEQPNTPINFTTRSKKEKIRGIRANRHFILFFFLYTVKEITISSVMYNQITTIFLSESTKG